MKLRDRLRLLKRRDHMKLLLEMMPPKSALPAKPWVYDFGCGDGLVMRALEMINPSWAITGFDIRLDSTRAACSKGSLCITADARDTSLPPASADIVYSVFMHRLPTTQELLKQAATLSEIWRVLKGGGHYVCIGNEKRMAETLRAARRCGFRIEFTKTVHSTLSGARMVKL